MKQILLTVIVLHLFSTSSLAIPVTPFGNTETYIERAKDIVIAECVSAPAPCYGRRNFQVEIKMVLKGDRKLGETKVFTIRPMQVGNRYLLVNLGGGVGGTDFLASAELSVVPIPSFVDIDTLKKKSLKDKLHLIFASRLHVVQTKVELLLRERLILEKGLADRTDNLYVSPTPVHIDQISTAWATDYQGDKTKYLEFDSKQMEWSKGGDQSGYIYSDAPGTKGPVWELASIEQSTFRELEGKKLQVRFSLSHIPPAGETRIVRVGQMILARHIDDPATIYAIRFDRQIGPKVFVEYAVIDGNPGQLREKDRRTGEPSAALDEDCAAFHPRQ
jgi:hypothetical protein